jgi:hypothetical protein
LHRASIHAKTKSRVLKARGCNTESPGKAVRPFYESARRSQLNPKNRRHQVPYEGTIGGSGALARVIQVQTCEGFTQVAADKLILEHLSALAWTEQAEAVTTFGNCIESPDVGGTRS